MKAESAGDFHNHLVPAVDDGAETLEDALDGIDRMAAAGIRRIVTTPHLEASFLRDEDAAEEYLERVSAGFAEVAAVAARRFPDLDFRRGHELRLDVPDPATADERIRLGGTSFLLVEWPRFQIPPATVEVLSRLRAAGVRPVIAHPERYQGIEGELALVEEWRRVGAYLQVNYGSLVGRYGEEIRRAAFTLLREGMADYFSTDFHGRPAYRLYKQEASSRLEELGATEQLYLLSVTNPGRLFQDEAPVSVPPLPRGRGFWSRVREIFR